MKKTLLSILSAAVITTSATIASASSLQGVEGTLANITTSLNSATAQAANLYEENHGKKMKKAFNVVKNSKNPYIHTLRISKSYNIQFKFDDKAKKGEKGRFATPVAKALLGKSIVLIPVYNKGDERITSWECLTNADEGVQEMMGSTGTKEFTASFIRGKTDNKYLSVCTFVNRKKLF